MHAAALRKQGAMPGYTKAPGPVTRRGNSACLHGIDQGCKNCDETKDRELFRLVLEAVQPFQRADTENVGIKVFDMTVSKPNEVYVHLSNCGCGSAATM